MTYKATTESELAESSGQFSVDYGEAWPPAATTESELAEFSRHFSVDDGEARPPGFTTESKIAESCGKFTVEIGEVRPPLKAKYTVEQTVDMLRLLLHEDIVDMPGPQYHEDMVEVISWLRKCILLSTLVLRECQRGCRRYSNLKVEVGHHFIRCRADDDDYREPLEWE